jgi:hypothetical protein
VAKFFGIEGELEQIISAYPKIASGYSKKPEERYTVTTRRKILQRTRLIKGPDIAKGLDWATKLIEQTESIRSCSTYLGI